jgi:hypothetical protein
MLTKGEEPEADGQELSLYESEDNVWVGMELRSTTASALTEGDDESAARVDSVDLGGVGGEVHGVCAANER